MKRVITATVKTQTYWYAGPVYRFKHEVSSQIKDEFPISTQAKSLDEAHRNIVYKLKRLLGLDPKKTKIEIDKEKINYIIEDTESIEDQRTVKSAPAGSVAEFEQPSLF